MKSNKLRSNLTVSIIAIGITALISIVTVIEVLKGTIHDSFSGMGSNTFTITAESMFGKKNKRHGKRKSNDENKKISLNDANYFTERYSYPAVVSTNILVSGNATLKHGDKKTNPNVMVMGCDEHYLKVSGSNLEAGRNFNGNEISSGENNCLLGYGLADKLFSSIDNAVGNTIIVNDERYRVIGVLESKGSSMVNKTDNMAFISLQNARQKFNITSSSAVISIAVNDIKHIDLAIDEAEGTMRTVRKVSTAEASNFAITKNDEIANTLIENLQFVTVAASLIGFITLLGAAIGLMNIMLVAVAERTREIGLTKAIGANSYTIRTQFLLEAIFISCKGGVVGIIIGVVLGNIVALLMGSRFTIPWFWIMLGISICVLVGILAGIYPAIRASKLNPINALRYE